MQMRADVMQKCPQYDARLDRMTRIMILLLSARYAHPADSCLQCAVSVPQHVLRTLSECSFSGSFFLVGFDDVLAAFTGEA
jgi:hypothetical protein